LNETIYIDFSHDNQMIAIYAALGLFAPVGGQSGWLDPQAIDDDRTWLASKLVPFSGRLITEKVACGHGPHKQELVRILVNDAVQPLEFCGAEKHGLCTLDGFVQSQAYARNDGDGDFDKCFL
jgi:Histidine phosphatase superfamily (branch 2)